MSAAAKDVFDWSAAPDLPGFLSLVTPLTADERRKIITDAKSILSAYYVHLDEKCATLGIDPLGALDRLSQVLPAEDDDLGFHDAMCDIFAELCDLHTHYTLPEPYGSKACLLPFKLAEYTVGGQRRVVVTEVQETYAVPPDQAGFAPGAEILTWNELPVQQFLAQSAKRSGGANEDARRARALAAMTLRPMQRLPPPRRPVVLVAYRPTERAPARDTIFPWRIITDAQTQTDPALKGFIGLDHEGEIRRRASARVYHQPKLQRPTPAARPDAALPTAFPGEFKAHALPGSDIGYVRIFNFAPPHPGPDMAGLIGRFVDEFARLLRLLPAGGLVLDVRGNSGGYMPLAESMLQTLTTATITPQPVELRATDDLLTLCEVSSDLRDTSQAVADALAQKMAYTKAAPLTDPTWCNGRPKAAQGPVVLIVDARCYSATDAFIAGFQDHDIGPVLGVSSVTGAGGANVWDLEYLVDALGGLAFQPWPGGAGLKFALRRTRRVGRHAGALVEGVGVKPDIIHTTTFADLLEQDRDLLACAVDLIRCAGSPDG